MASPVRLLVAILGSVGTHGWSVVSSIKAGTSKVSSMSPAALTSQNDVKSLLLSYSDQTAAAPPAYFAISFPRAPTHHDEANASG